ncbi:DNA-directed RNA polymerases I, II, and III subunit [Theileria orientalis]|uniref:DNA-directed RNA polymerases I, II, and III subunit RPABC3 n=1 Tax=Theileria orientalis TaxID=68886 RepID=A0A976M3N7_THEOR|nr:DNA-directed RNA polymerases I, II, and III subunit [Theileria orientalis]
MTTASCVFEDRFLVRSIDNSKFERVSRLSAKSTGFDAELLLDVNSDLLQVNSKAMLHILITNSLLPSGSEVNLSESPDVPGLLGDYEYAMYGKIFKFEEVSSETRTIYASFGGLLMSLTADKQVVADLDLDMKIYILVRRISANR